MRPITEPERGHMVARLTVTEDAMRLMVTLRLDGAAFDTDPGAECARILRELAERIANGALVESEQGIILRDENGNACGEAASAR